jgi:hypothetical protein
MQQMRGLAPSAGKDPGRCLLYIIPVTGSGEFILSGKISLIGIGLSLCIVNESHFEQKIQSCL